MVYECAATNASDGSIGRYYDPATGQFLTVDPLVDLTGQAYAYTGDDPVNGVDPMGLFGLNPISDIAQGANDVGDAAGDVVNTIVHHPLQSALIAAAVAAIVVVTVATAGTGDAVIAAGAAAADDAAATSGVESAAVVSESATTGTTVIGPVGQYVELANEIGAN